jgi:hypothetical protein
MPEEFSPNLFVGRENELAELIRWATTQYVPRRLKTIAAPPGYGKTWLLNELENRLREKNVHSVFVIRVAPSELRSRADIITWLSSIFEKARSGCPKVRDYDPHDSLESTIHGLCADLCEHCSPTQRPLLFVDALDELPENERKELEKHLLEQFWRNPCVRIMISLRDEYSLTSHNLRRSEERMLLSPFSKEAEGRQQLAKRSQLGGENLKLSQEELLKIVSPYPLKVPGINTILSKRIKQNEDDQRHPVLSAGDLRECWQTLIGVEFTRRPESPETLEEDLKKIVEHEEDTWTLETFANLCAYHEIMALYHIQSLMTLSIVSSAHKQRYQVVDGIREIIRAENRLRREGKL